METFDLVSEYCTALYCYLYTYLYMYISLGE